uniref:Chemokine (C-C motif) ligand 39, duplicate 2 n=1 Tax=Cyprinus carpio TaxID=7962 RepID=A0A8C2F054_CYPCA
TPCILATVHFYCHVTMYFGTTHHFSVAAAVPERCCFNFIDFPIPTEKIVSALKTGSKCPGPGIV